MSRPSSRRSRWFAIPLLALAGALLLPAAASAAKETFHRFEVEGTANYTLTEDCADGSTAETRITVIGGHEEESEEGVTTLDSDFLTVLIRGFDCDFNLINDRGSGPAEFTFSSGLERASVTGTIETEEGRTVTADIRWEGTGGLEITNNITTFPGFHGHFQGMERDAVATGTVVIDGETVVDGSTTNARIESLEDTNTTTSE
jgi:hypothetical protein